MSLKLFITGTDTEVGKTYVSTKILEAFNKEGLKTLGIKPVASGCKNMGGILYNDDAIRLQNASSIKLPYNKINPISFEPPIAPNIAANKINYKIELSKLNDLCRDSLEYASDVVLVEGIGGWNVPINDKESMADFAKMNNLSIVLVVGIKLGCLNHAILTYESITKSSLPFIGWVANIIDPKCLEIEANIRTLKSWLKKPCLDIIEYNHKRAFNLESLKKSMLI